MKNKEINLSSASLNEKEEGKQKTEEKVSTEENKVKKNEKKFIENIKKRVEKFKAWWNSAPKHIKILTIVIPALLLLGSSAFFFYYTIYGPRTRAPELLSIDTNYIPTRYENQSFQDLRLIHLSEPSVPRTEESPINGRLFTRQEMEEMLERRPIAAIVSNHIHARPTSNLNQADLVFETLVEGGITRFLAIYWANEPNKIGPIRSVRQYYLEWLSPFDPLFVYDGFASSSDPRVDARGNMNRYGIKSIYTSGAWRVPDRPAPHDEYSSTIKTWEIAEERGWEEFPNVDSWKFKNDATLKDRNDRFKGRISFSNSREYDVVWEYDKATNRYYRSIGGIKDTDLESGQQISAKNVVIQEVQVEGPVDQYNRLVITTTGSGSAAILQDGKIIYGKWEKDDRTSRTKFYDNNNREIEFNRGITWISSVRQIQENFDIIEQ